MILSAQSILNRTGMIEPFCPRTVLNGMSYGLSCAGYDIRIKEFAVVRANDFVLATTVERFKFPSDVMGMLCDKSTWARRGLAVQNTIFEPGWEGYPTLELSNHGGVPITVKAGMPIAQMIFHLLDQPTIAPYTGKYQNQEQRPVPPIEEKG